MRMPERYMLVAGYCFVQIVLVVQVIKITKSIISLRKVL